MSDIAGTVPRWRGKRLMLTAARTAFRRGGNPGRTLAGHTFIPRKNSSHAVILSPILRMKRKGPALFAHPLVTGARVFVWEQQALPGNCFMRKGNPSRECPLTPTKDLRLETLALYAPLNCPSSLVLPLRIGKVEGNLAVRRARKFTIPIKFSTCEPWKEIYIVTP
jgi:hypothetical protein